MNCKILFLLFCCLVCFQGIKAEDDEDFYKGSSQYGKSMALFGGSFTVHEESNFAKNYWCEKLNLRLSNYGSRGAGFSNMTKSPTIQEQVDSACTEESPIYDIYLFWASTNDFHIVDSLAGQLNDYTEKDNYDAHNLRTQCGGINYCFKKVYEKNPQALILFFTSIGYFPEVGKGTNPDYAGENGMNHFVEKQKAVCKNWTIPFLDQFDKIINENNWQKYMKADNLHLNENGYIAIREAQAKFIAYPYSDITRIPSLINNFNRKENNQSFQLSGIVWGGQFNKSEVIIKDGRKIIMKK